MKYKAVCFDIDGTLYNPSIMNAYMAKIAKRHPILAARYAKLRVKFREMQPDFTQNGFDNLPFREKEALAFTKICRGKSKESCLEDLVKVYYPKLEEVYRALPYQKETVETLEKIKSCGLKTGVLSDWPLFEKLKSIGVEDLVDFAISAEDAGYLKPDYRPFEFMLRGLDVKAEEALFVGDSYSKDILGAKALGMGAVLVNCRKPDKSKYPQADEVFANWKDFDSWINMTLEGNV